VRRGDRNSARSSRLSGFSLGSRSNVMSQLDQAGVPEQVCDCACADVADRMTDPSSSFPNRGSICFHYNAGDLTQYSDAVGFAIGDVEDTVGEEYGVGAIELAGERVRFRAVAEHAGSEDGCNHS